MQFLRKKSNRILSSRIKKQAKVEPEEDDWFSCAVDNTSTTISGPPMRMKSFGSNKWNWRQRWRLRKSPHSTHQNDPKRYVAIDFNKATNADNFTLPFTQSFTFQLILCAYFQSRIWSIILVDQQHKVQHTLRLSSFSKWFIPISCKLYNHTSINTTVPSHCLRSNHGVLGEDSIMASWLWLFFDFCIIGHT